MKTFLSDVKTAVDIFGKLRRIRKAQKEPAVTVSLKLPILNMSYWPSTMESCLLLGDIGKAARKVFLTFPEDVQHAMTFTPKSGEYADRIRLWQKALKPALPPKQYHEAIQKLIRWSIRCVRSEFMEKADIA